MHTVIKAHLHKGKQRKTSMLKKVHNPRTTFEVPNTHWATILAHYDLNPFIEEIRTQLWDIQ